MGECEGEALFGPRQIQLYRTLWSMWGMSHPRAADRPRATPPRLGYIIDLSAGHISKVVFGESGAYAIRVKPCHHLLTLKFMNFH